MFNDQIIAKQHALILERAYFFGFLLNYFAKVLYSVYNKVFYSPYY